MGKYFVKRKDYDALVGELQKLQGQHCKLKVQYENSVDNVKALAIKNNALQKDNESMKIQKERLIKTYMNTNRSKDMKINCLIKENTKLYDKIAKFNIDAFNSIQVNIKNRKKLRIRNKQNKKLNNDVIQHLVNIAFEK